MTIVHHLEGPEWNPYTMMRLNLEKKKKGSIVSMLTCYCGQLFINCNHEVLILSFILSSLQQNVAISIMQLLWCLTDECVPSVGWWSSSVLWGTTGKPPNVSPYFGWSNRIAGSDLNSIKTHTCDLFFFK